MPKHERKPRAIKEGNYRGRDYEDDPRALPPQRLIYLAPHTISGCGNSGAMCAAVGERIERESDAWHGRPVHQRAMRRIRGASNTTS